MVDVTFHGCKIVEVKKGVGDYSGSFVKIVVEGRNGDRSDVWFFTEDLSAFNEIKEPK